MEKLQLKKYLPSLIFAIILPVFAYLLLKMWGSSDTIALGTATAFPVLHMIWDLITKKILNPVSLVAIIGFLISLLMVYLTHGNNLAFKLWHPLLTGAIGLIFLISVLVNKPLLELASEGKESHRKMVFLTTFMGSIFALHALTVISLAFLLETTTFVIISKMVDFAAIGLLVVGLAFLRKKIK